jgi:hypothetical protein
MAEIQAADRADTRAVSLELAELQGKYSYDITALQTNAAAQTVSLQSTLAAQVATAQINSETEKARIAGATAATQYTSLANALVQQSAAQSAAIVESQRIAAWSAAQNKPKGFFSSLFG